MLLTPDEARKIGCPVMGVAAAIVAPMLANGDAVVTTPGAGPIGICAANNCPMWRWRINPKDKTLGRRKGSDDKWIEWGWDPRGYSDTTCERETFEFRTVREDRKGYCGLAGKPEESR